MVARALTRRLQKFSLYSTCLILPKKMVTALGWQPSDVVKVRQTTAGQLLIQKVPTRDISPLPLSPTDLSSGTEIARFQNQIPVNNREEDILPIPELR